LPVPDEETDMSYLDRPRVHFAGKFQASPATVNNTPNNFNPENYNQSTLKPERIELYWEPKGDSIFNLVNCHVTSAETSAFVSDPLIGAQVAALYTSSPPKLVDLDPMQQNGSELWGLTLMLGDFGGAYVQGLFTPVAFHGIWMISQGDNTPRNSASGAAAYQSTLTNLTWNVGNSAVLQALHAMSPDRLSIRIVVSAHNNAPQLYAFTADTFQTMSSQGVPGDVLTRMEPLRGYFMNLGGDGKPLLPGYIPTIEYVNYLLAQLLDPGTINQYSTTILNVTRQPYDPWINYKTGQPLPEQPLCNFNYGKIVGTVGPSVDGEPAFVTPARTLSPIPAPQRQTTAAPPPSQPVPFGWWAQCKLDLDASPPSLSLDLANSLPVRLPGRPLWSEEIGTLSLAYFTGSGADKKYTTIAPSLDYANPDFIDKQSGMFVITDFGGVDPNTLAGLPLAVLRTPPAGAPTPFLEESSEGWSLRADQFLYRMNPGLPTTGSFAQGDTNTVDLYVRKFGGVEGTTGVKIGLSVLDPSQAAYYTLSTLGTSGTNGINEGNLSTPTGKLTFPQSSVAVQDGRASVTITGLDPGNPRRYVDGQVYFMTYNFAPQVADFNQDPNDLVSVQVYQQNPITGYPTWINGVGDILRQYGMLYPIMGQFQLWSYQGVCENHDKIQRVLGLDISQPLHMPVSRDLSAIRCKLILDWFRAGMPYDQVGPAGGSGQSWNNLPEVSGWGPLTGLVIRSGDIIDAIAPVYGTRTAASQGGTGGTPDQVDITGDSLVAISGVTAVYFGATQVAQLTLTTAGGKTFGPFGTAQHASGQQSFDLRAPAGCRINSFLGATYRHTDGRTFIASIGGNVLPL
jgi:hypothetical protein